MKEVMVGDADSDGAVCGRSCGIGNSNVDSNVLAAIEMAIAESGSTASSDGTGGEVTGVTAEVELAVMIVTQVV